MKPIAVILAIVGGVVGALIWGLVGWLTGYEIGYIALAVGGLVGLGAVIGGARGKPHAVACALIAVAAIVLGKVLIFNFSFNSSIEKEFKEAFTQQAYDSGMQQAAEFSSLQSEAQWPSFMVKHDYAETLAEASEGLDEFRKTEAPRLREIHDKKPEYSAWKKQSVDNMAAMLMEVIPFTDRLKYMFGALDILFIILGVVTAYGIVAKRAEVVTETGKTDPAPGWQPRMPGAAGSGPNATPQASGPSAAMRPAQSMAPVTTPPAPPRNTKRPTSVPSAPAHRRPTSVPAIAAQRGPRKPLSVPSIAAHKSAKKPLSVPALPSVRRKEQAEQRANGAEPNRQA